jgi:hypothetical protein
MKFSFLIRKNIMIFDILFEKIFMKKDYYFTFHIVYCIDSYILYFFSGLRLINQEFQKSKPAKTIYSYIITTKYFNYLLPD